MSSVSLGFTSTVIQIERNIEVDLSLRSEGASGEATRAHVSITGAGNIALRMNGNESGCRFSSLVGYQRAYTRNMSCVTLGSYQLRLGLCLE